MVVVVYDCIFCKHDRSSYQFPNPVGLQNDPAKNSRILGGKITI